MFWEEMCYSDILQGMNEWLNELNDDKGVCRTAQATLGLLKNNVQYIQLKSTFKQTLGTGKDNTDKNGSSSK